MSNIILYCIYKLTFIYYIYFYYTALNKLTLFIQQNRNSLLP